MIVKVHFPYDKYPPFEVDIPAIPERNTLFYVDNIIPGGLGKHKSYHVKYVQYFVDENYRITANIQLESPYMSM